METFLRKPGALKSSEALQQADTRWRQIFETHFATCPKDFIVLLLHMQQENYTLEQLDQSIEQCLNLCAHQALDVDKIKLLLRQGNALPQDTLVSEKGLTEVEPKADFSLQIEQRCTAQLQQIQQLVQTTTWSDTTTSNQAIL